METIRRWVARVAVGLVLAILLAPTIALGQSFNSNPLVLDSQGKLLSWIQPQSAAYGRVVQLAWSGLKRVPVQSNGLKTYLSYAQFEPGDFSGAGGPHNPAGLYAMLADSALRSYPFLGDRSVLSIAQDALDYQLAHGLTADGWSWGHVPYASSSPGQTTYRGDNDAGCGGCGTGDGLGVIEPDKVGEEGYAYLLFWELSGNTAYRDAAITFANVLASHVRPGDRTHSPWPFRVNAQTNQVREEYTAHVLGPVMLFDELIRLNLGNVSQYRAARDTAWSWLMNFPMHNNGWTQYFEDVAIQPDPLDNLNQYVPLQTASYLISHPEFDPTWRSNVPALLTWVEQKFADLQHGAEAVSEQNEDRDKMGSHTARYAAVAASWYAVGGDPTWKDKAFRSFNWASYMVHSNGVVSVGVDGSSGWWFSDGYGDFIRHFMAGMAAVPEWAPTGENHLLSSSSVVQSVDYASGSVSYRTFDADSKEVLRLTFAPAQVTAGGKPLGQRYDLATEGYAIQVLGSDFIVRVRHASSGEVAITAELVAANPTAVPAPSPAPVQAPGPQPSTTPPAVSLSAGPPGMAHDDRYFAATGYRIDDDTIFGYFSSRGQVDAFGYPVSRPFALLGCSVQIFQRVVAQVCDGRPALLNLMDEDVFPYTQVDGSVWPAADDDLKNSTPRIDDADYMSAILDFVRATAVDAFEGQPVNFGSTFFGLISQQVAGTNDPIQLGLLNLEIWGAPISQPMRDPNNADFVYQRFQRGIMQFDASTGSTRGILLADYLKAILSGRDLPADLGDQAQGSRFYAQYCPGSAKSLCRPAELPGTDLTFAFEPG